MRELSESHCTARRLARASWKACHAGSRSGYSSWSSSLNRRKAPLPWIARASLIGCSVGEVGHVLVPDPGRQRVNDDQVQIVEVDRRLPVDAGIGRPERNISGFRVDKPVVFVVVLVGQRGGDLLQIDAAQVKHKAKIDLPTGCAWPPA
jgi:hypothetical protein